MQMRWADLSEGELTGLKGGERGLQVGGGCGRSGRGTERRGELPADRLAFPGGEASVAVMIRVLVGAAVTIPARISRL